MFCFFLPAFTLLRNEGSDKTESLEFPAWPARRWKEWLLGTEVIAVTYTGVAQGSYSSRVNSGITRPYSMTLGFTTCMLHSVKCCQEALQVKRGGFSFIFTALSFCLASIRGQMCYICPAWGLKTHCNTPVLKMKAPAICFGQHGRYNWMYETMFNAPFLNIFLIINSLKELVFVNASIKNNLIFPQQFGGGWGVCFLTEWAPARINAGEGCYHLCACEW